MPYNPGVSDRSGEILAGGITQGIGGLAQGLLRYNENEKQRQIAAGQITGLMSSNPQLAEKADPKMLDKLTTGKATLADTLQLLGHLTTARQADEEAMQQKLRQAQLDQYMQQERQRDANTRAAQSAAGMLAPETQAQFGERGGYVQANPAPMRTQPDAMGAAAAYLQQGGTDASMMGQLGQLAEAQIKSKGKGGDPRLVQLAPGVRVIVDQNGNARQPMADKTTTKTDPAAMTPINVGGRQLLYHEASKKTFDPATGQVVNGGAGKPPPNAFENALQGAVGKSVADFLDKAPEFQNTLEQIQRGRAALDAGATTGGLSGAKLGVAQTVNGLFPDTFKTAPTELARTSYADMALTAASRMRGQGQITEQERKLLADSVVQIGNSPEAARYIMSFMESAAQRNLEKAGALQQLRDGGESNSAKYSSVLSSWEKEHPIDVQATNAVPPPTSAIEYLKKNPALAEKFDAKYGQGASKRILGK